MLSYHYKYRFISPHSFSLKLVDLETIRPSDLAALNAATSLSIRGQTKLDKRPRVLYVTGHSTYDVEDFRQALAVILSFAFRALPMWGSSLIHPCCF